VKAVREHLAAPAARAIDVPRERDIEGLHAARQRASGLCLDEEVQVVALDRQMNDAKRILVAMVRSARRTASNTLRRRNRGTSGLVRRTTCTGCQRLCTGLTRCGGSLRLPIALRPAPRRAPPRPLRLGCISIARLN